MKKSKIQTGKSPKKGNQPDKVKICLIPTGVPGLDDIFGGGLPEYSFNFIVGAPGCGKTTLAHQIVFANATRQKPALYFTSLGEPALKMLRYQQQYTFYDPTKVNTAIRFINLSGMILERDLEGVLEEMIREVQASHPSMVVVDSFQNLARPLSHRQSGIPMEDFVQRLALFLSSWLATTFLIGSYSELDMNENPLFNVADGLFWLTQNTERNSVVRKLQILKLRGQASVPGLHTIRIDENGLQAFSRTLGLVSRKTKPIEARRLSIGIPELDKMMGGGIREGDSVLVSGPSGTGKSALATQFLVAGFLAGEPGIAAIFEERPQGYVVRARTIGLDLDTPQKNGMFEILYLRPLDLSVDETMQEILSAVKKLNAKRLVIDSLVGFEMALSPGFRTDYRESLYRMIAALTGAGVTIFTTVELEDTFTSLQLSHYTISFLTDDIIRLRYVEIDGQLRKVLVIIKMRGGNHSKDIREYIINDQGLVVIGPRQTEYTRLTTGLPNRLGQHNEAAPEP